ncbi:MAG TPA: cardiolipin synthase [Nocardioides sp.]|nr:cardiolipin synthase [Nocardioides sp.]
MIDWFSGLPAFVGALLVAAQVVIYVFALGIIPRNRKPSTGMAWLILVLAVPFFGLIMFLFFGSTRVERGRHEKQREVNRQIHAQTAAIASLTESTPRLAYVSSVAALNRNLGALPGVSGNRAVFFEDYHESIAAMAALVDTAERFVHVQFYITAWDDVTDPFFASLVRATERGVKVRLLFDHLGSRGIPVYKDLLKRLGETTIEWHPMMPVMPLKGRWRRPDLRNHRKILVVDGRAGFAGSQNLIEPGYDKPKNHQLGREWVELTTRVTGPAVAELNAVFLTDWYSETDVILEDTLDRLHNPADAAGGDVTVQVVPSGPGFATENNLRMFTTLLYSAQRRISITSPYFVPDESLLYAVTTAAQRGIDIELFVSEAADQFMVHHAQSSYYEALLRAGVRIYLYPAPYVLHSKHFTIDDDVAVIGSSNMDLRSFALNYEVSLMMLGGDVVSRMRQVEDHYRSLCRELTREEWEGRSFGRRYIDTVMRLTSALQ